MFNSTVEEKRMRFLYGKDAVGVGENPGKNKREEERRVAEGVLPLNLPWKLPKVSGPSLQPPVHTTQNVSELQSEDTLIKLPFKGSVDSTSQKLCLHG